MGAMALADLVVRADELSSQLCRTQPHPDFPVCRDAAGPQTPTSTTAYSPIGRFLPGCSKCKGRLYRICESPCNMANAKYMAPRPICQASGKAVPIQLLGCYIYAWIYCSGEIQPRETVMSENMERDDEILPALGYLASGMTAMLARLSREALAPFGITPVQIAILMYCSRNEANTIERLVGAIHLDQASISRHVARLVKKGLLRRTRPCEEDRRIVRLDLTEEGRAFMPRLIEAHQDLNALVNVGIGEEEKRIFLDVTRKIHENLQAGLHQLREAAAGEVRAEE